MNNESLFTGDDEVARPNVLRTPAKDCHRVCYGLGGTSMLLIADEPEDLLCTRASINRKPHTMQLTIENECQVGINERHIVFFNDVFVPESAAGMRHEEMHSPCGTIAVSPDGLHSPVSVPCISSSNGAAPPVSLEFGTGGAYPGKGVKMALDIDGFP
jgi:hypothetical protein